jgi:hypothetical protein
MSNLTELVDRYFAMWNETDGTRRRALIGEIWTATARYRDPRLEADGPDGIDAMVAQVQAAYPRLRFMRTSAIDMHHDTVRFTWSFGPEGGPALALGTDFGVVAGERLEAMTGFFDHLGEPASAVAA